MIIDNKLLTSEIITHLSGALSAATGISFGPSISLQPSTASSRARHNAIIGPLQTGKQNKTNNNVIK